MTMRKSDTTDKSYFMSELPDETRHWLQTVFGDILLALIETSLNTGLEVLRHLAIVNGAGLAGVTALFGSLDAAARPSALSAGAWFLVGLALAILTLIVVYASSMFAISKMSRAVGSWVANVEPFDKRRLAYAKWLAIPNWSLAALSLVAFIIGATKLAAAAKLLL